MSSQFPEKFNRPIENGRLFEQGFETHRFDPVRLGNLADVIIDKSLSVQKGDRLLIRYDPGARQLAELIAYRAALKGAEWQFFATDPEILAAGLSGTADSQTPPEMSKMTVLEEAAITWANKVSILRSNDFPNAMSIVPPDTRDRWSAAIKPFIDTRVENRTWNLVYLPTKAEAEMDRIPYPNYVDMFFRAVEQDWDAIEAAQDILINEILNPAKKLELFGGENLSEEKWRTHLIMSIDGQTFANSTIKRNAPGSEVFSSPKRYTVNGRLALPYPVMFDGRVIPNLILDFEDGKVKNIEIDSKNPDDLAWVKSKLDADEGASEVGEIAFGTNRAFNGPMLNHMYIEKVGGSFHLALGDAYRGLYDGKKVNYDNGVKSNNHIDLTCMMLKEYGGGRVIVDDKILVQKDGEFLDPRLTVLNSVKAGKKGIVDIR